MSENSETINPANIPKVEKSKSLSINKIGGKEVFITGYNKTRGKPTQFTPKEDIGEDGLTDFYTVKTAESFDLEYKDEGVIPINSFFIKPAQARQIERIPNYESVNTGSRIGPVKAIKRTNPANAREYWAWAFENDEDYK